jgi:hypothetical protein
MYTLERVTCNTPFFFSSLPSAVLAKAATTSLLITSLLFLAAVLSSLLDVRGEEVEGEQV